MQVEYFNTDNDLLGCEEYTQRTEALLPDLSQGNDVYLRIVFEGSPHTHWKVNRYELEVGKVNVFVEAGTRLGNSYGQESDRLNKTPSQIIQDWQLVEVDFGPHTRVMTKPSAANKDGELHGEINTVHAVARLPGEHHKLRPCVIININEHALTVVPLSTSFLNNDNPHAHVVSPSVLKGLHSRYSGKKNDSSAVINWMTTVSSYRAYPLLDSKGWRLAHGKDVKLKGDDKRAVQEGILACYYSNQLADVKKLKEKLVGSETKYREKAAVVRIHHEANKLLTAQEAETKAESEVYRALLLRLAPDFGIEGEPEQMIAGLIEAYPV
jgi:uncharacterized protein YifN (PemK superfamily)